MKDLKKRHAVELERQVSLGLIVFFSILVVACFMWSGALDRSDHLLSYFLISLA